MGFEELAALVERGDLRQERGDPAGALSEYELALKEAPDDPMIWNNRGVALSSLGRYDEAIGSYRKATAIRPGYWLAWFNLGKAMQRKADRSVERRAKADKAAGRGAPAVPAPELADIYEEAILTYDRALGLNPSHASTLNNKAVALRTLHRYEEALGVYDELIGIDPLYPHAWYNKGLLLRLLDLRKEADRCFEAAAGLSPEFAAMDGGTKKAGKSPSRRQPARDEGSSAGEAEREQTDLRDVEPPRRARRKVIR